MKDKAKDPDREFVQTFLRTRSESAFLALYDRHADAVYRFAARVLGGAGPEAADVVQETWMRALARLETFGWRSSLRTWLCGIALNRCRELRHKSGREVHLEVVDGTPRRSVLEPLDAIALAQALAQLPEGYREVLVLHDLEGYTHDEIAQHFGIAAGTSKSQLLRARRAMRAALIEKGAARHDG